MLDDPKTAELVRIAVRSTEHDRLGEEVAKLRRTL
jgi:hypothetical protein